MELRNSALAEENNLLKQKITELEEKLSKLHRKKKKLRKQEKISNDLSCITQMTQSTTPYSTLSPNISQTSSVEILKQQICQLKEIILRHEGALKSFQDSIEATCEENERLTQVVCEVTQDRSRRNVTKSFNGSIDAKLMNLSCYSPVMGSQNSSFLEGSLLCLDDLEASGEEFQTNDFEISQKPKPTKILKRIPRKPDTFTENSFAKSHISTFNI